MPILFLGSRTSFIFALAAAACSGAPAASGAAEHDDFGVEIRFDVAPARIVSLNPATMEILFAIGAGDRVVGRSRWDSWPDSAKLVAAIGDGIRPNIEAILAVTPDLVLLYASEDNRGAAAKLVAANVPTIAIRIDSISQFRRATRLLGRLVGDTVRANRVVDSVDATLDRVRAATSGRPRPTVFFHAWERPLMTIGAGSFLTELVEIAGGRNIYADLASPSPVVTLEDVVRRDPDIIVVAPRTAAALNTSSAWRAVRAVREGRVVAYDTNIVGRPSVTLGMAAVNLAGLLHPGAVR